MHAIKEINKTYRGLKTIELALEQRGQKEAVGNISGKGHFTNFLGHGGMLGAGIAAATGHYGAAAAGILGPKVLEMAPQAARAGRNLGVKASTMLEQLTQAAAQGNPWAKAQLAAAQAAPAAATNIAGEQL